MKSRLVLLLCALAPCIESIGSYRSSPCVASNSRTTFQGHSGSAQSDVCEWLGIPYASPPIGPLRFAPPVRSLIRGTFNADSYGYDCPQNQASFFAYPNATSQYRKIYANFVNQGNNTQSEDCLTLNVWAKPTKLAKPVIVWIHGGRYSAGTSNTPFYNGQHLANTQDVVVVTFNFRMNIFGFSGSPEGTQNVGFIDQYVAIAWVRDNIAAFGGDPTRITIVGQSSGAQAVGNWAYAFKRVPIVAGLVSHSGNVFSFPINTLELAAKNWYNVSGTLGCGNSGNTLACMRSPNITFSAILAAIRRVPPPPSNSATRSQPAFQITADNKTAFSVSEYSSRLSSGNLARLPYFQIENDHESGFYRISALAQGRSPSESEWTSFEQTTFTCPKAFEAHGRAKLSIPNYRARYMADWRNLRLFDDPSSGAYHGVEINMITGNSEVVSGITPEAEQVKLTKKMQDAWAAFARDPVNGLDVFGWPKYEVDKETQIKLGTNTTSSVEFVSPAMYDEVCPGLGLDFWDGEIQK
ncbi:Alpha/Beta hydrolase protein [Pyrenochaeta sp. MPI-SDFR-AT-0127]|nr:Alpha/Beta hydrolase protein [Pyrenochaeta sp. MPI-SDFR-AT-0127]